MPSRAILEAEKTFHYGPIKGLCSFPKAHNWLSKGRFASIWVELQQPFGYNTTNNSQTGGLIETAETI